MGNFSEPKTTTNIAYHTNGTFDLVVQYSQEEDLDFTTEIESHTNTNDTQD